jgi:hypothetical protein
MSRLRNRTKAWIVTGAAAATVLTAAGVAAAATGTSSGASSSTGAGSPAGTGTATVAPKGAPDPRTVAHGPGETLLTGTTAAKVRAAALAAVPGATVIRVETDSAGSAYEAHLTRADGSVVTVKVDRSFAVTSTVSGFGGPGRPGASGQPPNGAAPTPSG